MFDKTGGFKKRDEQCKGLDKDTVGQEMQGIGKLPMLVW